MARHKAEPSPAPPKSGTVSGFRDAYKKAVTELLILRLLRDRDMYAYEMQREMELRSAGALTFNTLYLAIYRLKDLGYIGESRKETVEGRERVYFGITPEGLRRYRELRDEYRRLSSAVADMLPGDGETEEVGRRYSFPLAFRVKEPEELTGEAAERVREAEAELLQRYRLEQVQQTRVAVMFSDGAGKALRPKDGWYDLGKASSVTVAWAGLTPDTVRLFYTPSGTDTAEETRLLGVRVPEDGGGEVSFAITELDMPASLLGHIQAELDYGTVKAVSEIYKAVYEPEG